MNFDNRRNFAKKSYDIENHYWNITNSINNQKFYINQFKADFIVEDQDSLLLL
jgi:hypothetical protein